MDEQTTPEETTASEPGTEELLNQPLPGEEETVTEETTQTEDPPQEETQEVEQTEDVKPKKKGKPRIVKRLDRERAAREALERENEELRRQIPQQQQAQPKNGAPDPNDYEHGINDINFINANARWEAKQAYYEEREKDIQAQQAARFQQSRQKAHRNFESRMDEAEEKYPGLAEKVEMSGIDFSYAPEGVRHALKSAKNVGEIMNYFANEPNAAMDIIDMEPIEAVMAIGELNRKLRPKKETAKPVSKAPKPVSTIKGKNTTQSKTYNPNWTTEEFLANTSIHDLE